MLLNFDKELQEMVEKSLINDLRNFFPEDTSSFSIDWSEAIEEGSGVEYKDTFIETASDVIVKSGNAVVGYGWIDHIMDVQGKIYSFWTTFNRDKGGTSILDTDFGIPQRVWTKLSEEDKKYLAETHQGWSQDQNLVPYRKIAVTRQIQEYSEALKTILKDFDEKLIPNEFDSSLFKKESDNILKLANIYLTGELMDPNISTDTYLLNHQIDDMSNDDKSYVVSIMGVLNKLEGAVRHAAIAISNRASL